MSCGKGNGPTQPDGDAEGKNFLSRTADWNVFIDHAIQAPVTAEVGHIDVSNVVIGHKNHWELDIYGYIVKGGYGEGAIKGTTAVVAWAEKSSPEANWEIYFRVVAYMWSGDHYLGDRIQVANPYGADQTYPAVTANWFELPGEPGDIFKRVIVDIAYESQVPGQIKEVWHRRYKYIPPQLTIPPFDNFFEEPISTGPVTQNLPWGPAEASRHPDIIFYAFLGYEENDQNECETVFITYEYQYDEEYMIVQTEYDTTQNEYISDIVLMRNPRIVGEMELREWSQYPRMDAGLDFGVLDGTSVVWTVWHTLKWVGQPDPYDNPLIFDIDWDGYWVDISAYPKYPQSAQPVTPNFPNAPGRWGIFPYVDIDPIEKFFEKDFRTFAHFVFTKAIGNTTSFNITRSDVWYASSSLLNLGLDAPVVTGPSVKGLATLAMYPEQDPTDQEPDFDVLFLDASAGTFPVFSNKVKFGDELCLAIFPALSSVMVSDPGNESAWIGPLSANFIFKPPVGAIFDWQNEEAVWATGDPILPLAYGDYEFE